MSLSELPECEPRSESSNYEVGVGPGAKVLGIHQQSAELGRLLAAQRSWAKIQPSIFGTKSDIRGISQLFERHKETYGFPVLRDDGIRGLDCGQKRWLVKVIASSGLDSYDRVFRAWNKYLLSRCDKTKSGKDT